MENKTPNLNSDRSAIAIDFDGPKLLFDLPGLRIGCAAYTEGPTGCTLFYFPNKARFAVDIRGGSPGVLLSEQWESGEDMLDAICLCGGSIYGLEAISGVNAELLTARNFSTAWQDIPSVYGAVIYDFRRRSNWIHPDKELGRAAFRSAKPGLFPLGRAGVGASATVGKLGGPDSWEFGGQGGAFRKIGDICVAIFTVVNALGAVVDRRGKVVRGNFNRLLDQRIEPLTAALKRSGTSERGNTTLTVLVTNQQLSPFALRQVAKQVHCSMARAIQPFHGMTDGDVFFAVSTGDKSDDQLSSVDLGIIASELAWDAVLASIDNTLD
jgi:6-aminohexanoate-oligomer endohydrolase